MGPRRRLDLVRTSGGAELLTLAASVALRNLHRNGIVTTLAFSTARRDLGRRLAILALPLPSER